MYNNIRNIIILIIRILLHLPLNFVKIFLLIIQYEAANMATEFNEMDKRLEKNI